jgi:hypothetical protein
MRFNFDQGTERFAGFADAAARAGETARVVTAEFLTTDDGDRLFSRAEQLYAFLAARAPAPIPAPSQIDHMCAFFHRSGAVDVFVNEPGFTALTQVKTSVVAGAPVMSDQVSDVVSMVPSGVAIPADAGHFVLFSHGWRKAVVYDFGAASDAGGPSAALGLKLGAAFSYLLGRSRFTISEEAWQRLLEQRWFPFIGLPAELLHEMIAHAEAGWSVDDLLPRLSFNTRTRLPAIGNLVKTAPTLERHRKVIEQAFGAFDRSDYALVTAALLPRVEGIIRERHANRGAGRASQTALVETVGKSGSHTFSLMLPRRLATYLEEVFFGPEDFTDPARVRNVTRHAVAHGVVSDGLLGEKEATLAVLLVEQLTFLMGRQENP